MERNRAERIAESFSDASTFRVERLKHGLLVAYQNSQAYFESEQGFWPFIFHVAQAGHEESLVSEAEAELHA